MTRKPRKSSTRPQKMVGSFERPNSTDGPDSGSLPKVSGVRRNRVVRDGAVVRDRLTVTVDLLRLDEDDQAQKIESFLRHIEQHAPAAAAGYRRRLGWSDDGPLASSDEGDD